FVSPRSHRYLLSFPTRRSSDLVLSFYESLLHPGLHINPYSRDSGKWRSPKVQLHPHLLRPLQVVYCVSPFRSGETTVSHLRCLRSEEHTSELQSRENLVCRLLL